ncbi:hypothetical protein DFQ29_005205, partial [Apophysomyces sp. BC1021]
TTTELRNDDIGKLIFGLKKADEMMESLEDALANYAQTTWYKNRGMDADDDDDDDDGNEDEDEDDNDDHGQFSQYLQK